MDLDLDLDFDLCATAHPLAEPAGACVQAGGGVRARVAVHSGGTAASRPVMGL